MARIGRAQTGPAALENLGSAIFGRELASVSKVGQVVTSYSPLRVSSNACVALIRRDHITGKRVGTSRVDFWLPALTVSSDDSRATRKTLTTVD